MRISLLSVVGTFFFAAVSPCVRADAGSADSEEWAPIVLSLDKDESSSRQNVLRNYLEQDPLTRRLRARSDVNLEEAEKLLEHRRQLDDTIESGATGAIPEYEDDVGELAKRELPQAEDPDMMQYFIGEDDIDIEPTAGPGGNPPPQKRSAEDKVGGGKKKRTITAPYGTGAGKKSVNQVVGNYWDSTYYTTIQLGTPGTWFSVVIDTGSADLWVPSSACGTPCAQRKKYNPAWSRTSYQFGVSATVYYGLGSATGPVFQDVLRIGGLQSNQSVFINAVSMSNNQPASVDGLMGLSFSALSWANYAVPRGYKGRSSVIENLWNQGQIPAAAFGIWLSAYNPALPTKQGGELAIGTASGNPARYRGPITWLAVPNTSNWWHVAVDQLTVDASGPLIPAGAGIRAIVDTGTALIVTDPVTAAAANAKLGAYSTGIAGIWGVNCGKLRANPVVVTFTMGGRQFQLTGADLPVQVYPTDKTMCYAPFMSAKFSDKNQRWILGEVFLRKFYAIYDYNVQPSGAVQPRVGFATSIP